MSRYRILALDLGSSNTGYGFLVGDHTQLAIKDFGVIRSSPKQGPIRQRIDYILNEITQLVHHHHPNYFVFEDFTAQGRRAKAAGKIGQHMSFLTESVRGLARFLDFETVIYPNDQWKKLTLGIRTATKEQVKHYVSWKIPQSKALLARQPSHVWDAVCIAYCHYLTLLERSDNK